MKQVVVTGIVVKNDQGQILMLKKQPGVGPYAGTYLTPGGGVNPGETLDEAVQRELFEETGVRVKNLQRFSFEDAVTANWKGDEIHFIMLAYTGDYISGDLKPTEGNDDLLAEVRWVSPEELKTLPLSPPLKKWLKMMKYEVE